MKLGEKIWMGVATALVGGALLVSGATPMVSAATLSGILYVVLVAAKRWEANIFGAILAVIFGYLSFQVGFFANAAVNMAVLAPMSLFGVFYWKKNSDAPPASLTRLQSLLLTIASTIAIAITYQITLLNGSNLPALDAITGVLPVVATFLLVGRFKQQWYLWIPYNAIEVFMWFTVASAAPEVLAILVMRVVFLINSLYGAYNWLKN